MIDTTSTIATVTEKVVTSAAGQAVQKGLFDYAGIIGLSDTDPRLIIARLIRVGISFLGIIFLLIVLQSGVTMMLSGGDDEKVQKAKKMFFNGFIGLFIILSAYSIVQFVLRAMLPQ